MVTRLRCGHLPQRLVGGSPPLAGQRLFATKKANVLKEGTEIPLLTFNFEGVSSYSATRHALFSTEDLFAGKRSLVFHDWLFAPKNFRQYLPFYEKLYNSLKANGIDEIYCASFNDGYVMRHLFLEKGCREDEASGAFGFQKVKPLPGGNRLFRSSSRCSWSNLLNVTSIQSFQRSAAIINDMQVEKLFTEENSAGDTQTASSDDKVASAPNVLSYLRETFEQPAPSAGLAEEKYDNLLPKKIPLRYPNQFEELGVHAPMMSVGAP